MHKKLTPRITMIPIALHCLWQAKRTPKACTIDLGRANILGKPSLHLLSARSLIQYPVGA